MIINILKSYASTNSVPLSEIYCTYNVTDSTRTAAPRAFAIAGPSAWNCLPDPISNPNATEDACMRLLKTFLFAWY